MSLMFYNSNAESIDLSSFDTSNVINMAQMFYGTDSSVIYVSDKFVTDKVTSSSNMFTISTNLVGCAGTVYNSSYEVLRYLGTLLLKTNLQKIDN